MRVLRRAIWRRTFLISATFSSCPVALRNRRFNDSCLVARSSSTNSPRSSSLSSVLLLAISDHLFARDDARLDRKLLHGLLERGVSLLGVGEAELEQNPAGTDHGHPELRVALARTHSGLGRLLGDRLVREDVDPDLATTLDGTGHGDTGSLDLAGGQPTRLEGLDAVLAEAQRGTTLGHAIGATAVLLAVLDLTGHQHDGSVL